MAVTLTSSTEPVEEMQAALEAHGQSVVTDGSVMPPTAQPSAPPAKPGESPAAAPEGESAPASEAGEKKPQEVQAPKPGEKPVEAKPGETPRRGDFESRRKTLERRVENLSDQLEVERGSKTKLQQQLDEAQAELARIKPVADAQPKADAAPVKPKRPPMPSRESVGYDEAQYEAAMKKYNDVDLETYDQQMTEYWHAVSKIETAKSLREDEEKRQQKERQAEAEKTTREFVAAVDEQKKGFDDWQELVEAMPEEPVPTTDLIEGYIIGEATHKAALIRHFMLDHLDNGGKEIARFQAMSSLRQAKEIVLLEERLAGNKPEPPAAKPPVVEAAPPAAVEPPKPERTARQRLAATPPVEPIEPVGSRSNAGTAKLEQAKSAMEFIRLRRQGVNR